MSKLKVGDKVRMVCPLPEYGADNVKVGDEGVIVRCNNEGGYVVNYPHRKGWLADASDLELIEEAAVPLLVPLRDFECPEGYEVECVGVPKKGETVFDSNEDGNRVTVLSNILEHHYIILKPITPPEPEIVHVPITQDNWKEWHGKKVEGDNGFNSWKVVGKLVGPYHAEEDTTRWAVNPDVDSRNFFYADVLRVPCIKLTPDAIIQEGDWLRYSEEQCRYRGISVGSGEWARGFIGDTADEVSRYGLTSLRPL